MISLKKKIIVAIDGYSSCGKSSFAKLIAYDLGYLYLDSGSMYRAVALFALNKGYIEKKQINQAELIKSLPEIHISFNHKKGDNHILLNDKNIESEIRSVEVSSMASTISKIAEVRSLLVRMQQDMGKEKGMVMDGRDIGTVVFPNAEIKIFMTADMNVRAKRRYDELISKGIPVSFEEVLEDIKTRDNQDKNREISPLRQAEDATLLDNSYMTFDDQMNWFHQLLTDRKLLAQQ